MECGASECDRESSIMGRTLPTRAVAPWQKREEHKLQVSEKRVPKKIFVLKDKIKLSLCACWRCMCQFHAILSSTLDGTE
jgi:hypothetical protein